MKPSKETDLRLVMPQLWPDKTLKGINEFLVKKMQVSWKRAQIYLKRKIFSKDKDPKKNPISQMDSNNLSALKQLSVLSDKPKKLEKKRIFSTKYSCYICKKGDWNSYHALKRHQLRSHVGRNGLLNTKFNNINIETSHDIQPESSHVIHKNKLIRGTDKSFICTLCDKKYTSNYQLKIHTRNIHDGIVVNCRKCGKQVKSLVYHKKVCQITYPCVKCDKIFNYNSSLKDHIESIHEGIKHICSFCGSKHATKRGLNKHMRVTCQGIDKVKDLTHLFHLRVYLLFQIKRIAEALLLCAAGRPNCSL
ncbi:KRAB [Lepeophtheirus salmonis]|uniref:KRAB n=1 Tax=Lepeophtheirus salmonis TaxID=72036 RepID=A0A7R8CML4_LEPSM|nr:KRAB [Lepeophtheirus salmonis]CAF2865299.1 KRAB [Lepeophtheirus salmonis]